MNPIALTSRRSWLIALSTAIAGSAAHASDDADGVALIQQLTGKTPVASSRVRLMLPPSFPNGYTVPLSVQIDSPMTAADFVTTVRVLAPKNPLVQVATFTFTPASGLAYVSTRVRLAGPQFVLATAEMNDGSLLMTKSWVDVATDGCK